MTKLLIVALLGLRKKNGYLFLRIFTFLYGENFKQQSYVAFIMGKIFVNILYSYNGFILFKL